jgi:proteasome lid subunit RPN8/RPN11
MTVVTVRLRRDLLAKVHRDLARRHPFAFERVGFLFGCTEPVGEGAALILVRDYTPVPDAQYLRNSPHGATIGSAAIRAALQRALDTGDSVLHVHEHGGASPAPSGTDLRTYRELTPSFAAAAPKAVHGGLVLGDSGAHCLALVPGAKQLMPTRLRVIGRPLAFWDAHDE